MARLERASAALGYSAHALCSSWAVAALLGWSACTFDTSGIGGRPGDGGNALVDAAGDGDAQLADAADSVGTDGRPQSPDAAPPDATPPPPDAPSPCPSNATILSDGLAIDGIITGSDPKWHRPSAFEGCPAPGLSQGGTNVGYDTFVFCNLGATQQWRIAMDGADEELSLTHSDPYLVIYSGAQIAVDTLDCIAGDDDDSPLGNGAEVSSVSLPSDSLMVVVATGFSNDDGGSYQLRILQAP